MQNNENTITIKPIEEDGQLQSPLAGYVVLGFEIALLLILCGIMVYFFSSKRKQKVESPKYAMMEDDEDNEG